MTASIAWLALVISIGVVSCVRLDKPKEVAACAALNNCSDNPLPTGTGGAAGKVPGTGGAAGAATGGSSAGGAGGATTGPVQGSGGASAGGATTADASGAAGSGGRTTDAAVDAAAGGAGAAGVGGTRVGTGGSAGAGGVSVTGGVSGTGGVVRSGGAPGSGGVVASGGTTAAGGAIGTGGSVVRDAGVDVPPDASPLLTGLVAYYTFESATGTALPDSSGRGNTGKLSIGLLPDGGAPTGTGYEFVSGKVGKGLSMHKTGVGYVVVPNAVFANATDITIAVWANVTSAQNWQRVLDVGINAKLGQNTQTGTKYLNLVPKNDGSNMLFSITTNGYGSEQMLSAAQLAIGTWTHLAVVLAAGGGGRLYVNGSEANVNASLTLRPTDLGAVDYAFIGKSQFTADPAFDGVVDEFRVYNRALTAAEIQALYNYTGS